jgi:hypothetical protein
MGTLCLPGTRAAESSAPNGNSVKRIKLIGMQGFIIGFFTEMFGDRLEMP